MVKYSKCYLNAVLCFFIVACFSCQQTEFNYYAPALSDQQKEIYSERLVTGRGWYYQGTPSEQLVFDEARILDPTNASAHRELGVPYLKRGFAAEYFKHYENAVEHDALNWQGWRAYLYLYFYRDYDRAIVDCDAMDVLTPDFVDFPQATSVDYMRGIAYMQKEEYLKALSFFDKHIDFEKKETGLEYMESISFLQKAYCHYRMNDLDKAVSTIDIGLTINPNSADLNYWKALYLLDSDLSQSKICLEKADDLFSKGNYNKRPYVEEFNQIYRQDLEALGRKIGKKLL